jgi:hypothetical protein
MSAHWFCTREVMSSNLPRFPNEVSDAGIDPLLFVRLLLPAFLPVLTHFSTISS